MEDIKIFPHHVFTICSKKLLVLKHQATSVLQNIFIFVKICSTKSRKKRQMVSFRTGVLPH